MQEESGYQGSKRKQDIKGHKDCKRQMPSLWHNCLQNGWNSEIIPPFIKLLIFIMFVKIIKSHRDIVAVCDSELLGKKFEEGKFQLDVKESFFSGEEFNEEQTIQIMKRMSREDATFNIIGKASVSAALKADVITEEGIKKIKGIPFALVLL